MAVPIGAISLQDVCMEIYGNFTPPKSLNQCFTDATGIFDPVYNPNSYGNKNNLLNFQNYGSMILYGLTDAGGTNSLGNLFQYFPTASTVVDKIDFNGTTNGSSPRRSLIKASDGMLYGLTNIGGSSNYGILFQYNPTTSTLVKKIDFVGTSNGSNPYGSLMQASDGMLYGLTELGGINYYGTLFQYNPTTSILTKKIDFNGTNGTGPHGSLMQASDGMLYGTTWNGGTLGGGVLFQYNPTTSTLVKKIDFVGTNGLNPNGSLMQASDGMLYGLTSAGGTSNTGILFQYNPTTSTLVKKIDFVGTSNGSNPYGSLMQASDGMLYGLTNAGGTSNTGILFQYNPTTSTLVKKIDFVGTSNGSGPNDSLMQASDDMLYGLTTYGGTLGKGTLFQYNPTTSILTKKIDFNGTNGGGPFGSLIQY
jgi:uncharacterized repeat protein (TIGR03803 family)